MTNAIYLSMTIDELIEDFSKYNKKQLYSRYGGNVIRVLLRPKDWKEELYEEYKPDKAISIARKYNINYPRVKQVYNLMANKKRKEKNDTDNT